MDGEVTIRPLLSVHLALLFYNQTFKQSLSLLLQTHTLSLSHTHTLLWSNFEQKGVAQRIESWLLLKIIAKARSTKEEKTAKTDRFKA